MSVVSQTQYINRAARLSDDENFSKCSRVELMLSAKNLKDRDILTVSDPICVVQQLSVWGRGSPRWVEIGRTEVVYNNLNPEWNTKVYVDYFFESQQRLRFDLYDVDSLSRDLTKHDFLGRCECHLASIVAAPGGTLTLSLTEEPNQKGTLKIRSEEVDEGQKENAHFVCQAIDLNQNPEAACFWGLCSIDAFLEFYRLYSNGSEQLIHRTEVFRAHRSTEVEWRPFEVTIRHLCEGDKNRLFMVKCYDYRFHGRHKLIGTATTSINALVRGNRQLELRKSPITTEQNKIDMKKSSEKGKVKEKLLEKTKRHQTPHIEVVQFHVQREFTWLEYIASGLQLDFAVAVDFTASNGQPSDPTSLHYTDRRFFNQYEAAIRAVLEVCEHYNASRAFHAYGFGAKTPPSWEVSHLFPLDFSRRQSRVQGVQGVINSYRVALSRVELSGPTNFEPCIRIFHQKCLKMPRDGSRYQILLILTNGRLCDVKKTTLAIIEASDQPLSIVIVGVGDGDFTLMEELDSDDRLLEIDGRVARRDIVQFVPFREFIDATTGVCTKAQQSVFRARLAREVLAEVPFQVTSFMKANGIVPKKTKKR